MALKVWGQATSLPAFRCPGRPRCVPQSLVCPEAVASWLVGHSSPAVGKTVLPAKPQLAGATPAKVSGTCLVNPSLDLGGLWRRRNAVGKMALALESEGSVPLWQGRGWGLRWYNHYRWEFDDISPNHKRPSAFLDLANPLVQRDMCTRRFSAVLVIAGDWQQLMPIGSGHVT